jgi:hypothetical protein
MKSQHQEGITTLLIEVCKVNVGTISCLQKLDFTNTSNDRSLQEGITTLLIEVCKVNVGTISCLQKLDFNTSNDLDIPRPFYFNNHMLL